MPSVFHACAGFFHKLLCFAPPPALPTSDSPPISTFRFVFFESCSRGYKMPDWEGCLSDGLHLPRFKSPRSVFSLDDLV